MLQRLARPLLFAMLLPSCVRCAPGQDPNGGRESDIAGTVRIEDGDQPIPGVRVELRTFGGGIAHSAIITGSRGEFLFGQFRAGHYEIIAELEGYQVTHQVVEVPSFEQTNVVVRLRKQLVASSPSGDTTTAHELAIPEKARAAYQKGVAKADSHADYKGAVLEFQRAINNYRDYYEAYSEMGMAYVRLKDFPAAEKALRRSVEMSEQKYPPPLILLSMLLNDQNRPVDAEPIARQAISADPNAWRGSYELSRALLGLRRLPEAEASAYAARDLKPENPEIYLLLSEIHRRTQNPPALLQDLDSYLKLAPQGPAAPQVRQLREQLVKFIQSQPNPATAP